MELRYIFSILTGIALVFFLSAVVAQPVTAIPPNSQWVGTITLHNETHDIWRSTGGISGGALTFSGTEGRTVDTRSTNPLSWAGEAFPDLPAGVRVGILGPWHSSQHGALLGAYLRVVDMGATGMGAVRVSTYDMDNPAMTVTLSQIPSPSAFNCVGDLWYGTVPNTNYVVYYSNSQRRFMVEDMTTAAQVVTTQYDSENNAYWGGMANDVGMWEVKPMISGAITPTWNPSNPPSTMEILVIPHMRTGYWQSV